MKTPQMELRNFQSNTFKGISQKIVEITKSSSFWKVISIWNVRPTVVARYLWQPCQQEPPLHAATNSPVTLKGIQWSILTWLHTYQYPKVRGWKEIVVQNNKQGFAKFRHPQNVCKDQLKVTRRTTSSRRRLMAARFGMGLHVLELEFA